MKLFAVKDGLWWRFARRRRRRKRRTKTSKIVSGKTRTKLVVIQEDDLWNGTGSVKKFPTAIVSVILMKPRGRKMPPTLMAMLLMMMASLSILLSPASPLQRAQALHVTNFRVPAYVPITLPTVASQQQHLQQHQHQHQHQRHQLADLVKPILFDCDYDYQPEEDSRLTVRWFRNKEPEPFYQWLPELNVRHFADWIKPLLNQSFVSDPHDPMKRYRSLLIKRLSMNLTGQYTCLVSSLAGQDMRQSTLVVYQAPRAFTFEHRVFPAPAALPGPPSNRPSWPSGIGPQPITSQQQTFLKPVGSASPTHFKSFSSGSGTIVRPPNNNMSSQEAPGKIVYTHDGRPILKPAQLNQSSQLPKSKRQISDWMLKKRLAAEYQPPRMLPDTAEQQQQQQPAQQMFAIQLHHIQCQALQVTPRPIIALLVKRDAESIVQYLHESSSFSIRAHQVNQADYYQASNNNNNSASSSSSISSATGDEMMAALGGDVELSRPSPLPSSSAGEPSVPMMITLYDITVSATVALNVSLSPVSSSSGPSSSLSSFAAPPVSVPPDQQQLWRRQLESQQPTMGATTVLPFKRGQRMSFECHLEITGTEFEQRKRININEQEVYQFVEMEQQKRRHRQQDYDNTALTNNNLRLQDAGGSHRVSPDEDSSSATSNRLTIRLRLLSFASSVTTIICFITSALFIVQGTHFGRVVTFWEL